MTDTEFSLQTILRDMEARYDARHKELIETLKEMGSAFATHVKNDTDRFTPLENTNNILVWTARTTGVALIGGLIILMFKLLTT